METSNNHFRADIAPKTGRSARPALLEPLPLGLNHPSEKKMLKIKELEHILRGKVDQLFRTMF
jgi:hypothetical protein